MQDTSDLRPSKKQKELLNFIDSFIAGHGYGPSYREIMRALDYKSVSTVAVHINGLIAKDFVRKKNRSARSLEVSHPLVHSYSTQKVSKAEEKWLIDRIEAKFSDYHMEPTGKKRDDLFVLVGALYVLGLDEAGGVFKAKLPQA